MRNKEIMTSNKQKLKELEQNYIDDKINEMPVYIEQQKEKIVQEMIEYAEKHKEAVKWDRDGNPIEYGIKINPLVISNYFLKPVSNLSSVEPIYSPEKLGLIYDYYCYLIAEINENIGYFPPSLTSFCKLSSITLNTLRRYKSSEDYSMRVVAEKIYDQIGDENITMSQMGVVRERSTIFKMKSQNEITEKIQPNVNISVKTIDVDLDKINERLANYSNFTKKKGK